ncbi:PAS domain S-box-containing protein [Methylobacterium sp. ap11]|uniref:PAS domain-containing protein n=1 Tax=Methylobacterium sp. ap11 TaxID=1761799 RepID=UPI0008BF9863|nr:PAS domain-containing protein [Methylobacterium sp. ap11]SEP49881.1 PAS domain S-box-containing protein [Methylobacterium sp. ap11]
MFGSVSVSGDLRAKFEALDRSQAVIEFAPDGTILMANDQFLAAMGYALDEVRGRHHGLFVDPADRASEAYLGFWQRLGRGAFEAGEFRCIAKGGREVWIQATYNPILAPGGEVLKVVKFAADITPRCRSATCGTRRSARSASSSTPSRPRSGARAPAPPRPWT